MNNLHSIEDLRNVYYAMRHGRSLANQEGIIVSHPEHAVHGYGLTESGRAQVEDSIRRAVFLDRETRIFSSDFLRARETSERVHGILGCTAGIKFDPRLRERNFGRLELRADDQYPMIWEQDKNDAEYTSDGVESPASVMSRTTMLVSQLEAANTDRVFLLVSHGDPLQILRAAFCRLPASAHRDMPAIETAQISRFRLARL